MATVTRREIIEEMIGSGGSYRGDPVPWSVWEYRDVLGEVLWAVFYDQGHFDLDVSNCVLEYRQIWSRELGRIAPVGVLEVKSDAVVEVD